MANANQSFDDRIGDCMSEELPDAAESEFSPAWRTVSFGAGCMSVGAIFFVAGMMFLPILVALNAEVRADPFALADERSATVRTTEYPVLGCVLVILVGAMLWLAGLCLGCLVPPEAGVRPMAAAALVLWLAMLVSM